MKGYPKSKFDLYDQTSVLEIDSSSVNGNSIPMMMQTYTSDKGSEDWEILYGLTNFTTAKGGLSFAKHGLPQLMVAEILRSGSCVLAKRLVSADAKLANVTIRCRVVVVDGVSYLYFYTKSAPNVVTLEDAAEAGYNAFDPDAEATDGTYDIPLFTVSASGRGVSGISIRLVPEYYASKSGSYIKYSFEVIENNSTLESIMCTVNPDIVYDNVNQSIETKVNNISVQVKAKIFEDGIVKLVNVLAETAKMNDEAVSVYDLSRLDFINGLDIRGANQISGIVTKNISVTPSEDGSKTAKDLWEDFKPNDIEAETIVSLDVATGIRLSNGSYGTMGTSPIKNADEMKALQLGAFGKNEGSHEFDPCIYDLDNYKVDAIFDTMMDPEVKAAITDLVDFRGDMVYFADLGGKYTSLDEIITAADNLEKVTASRNVAVYHNTFKMLNPYDKKQVEVSLPILLAKRIANHIDNGVGRPFAGIANNMYFSEIITSTINFTPNVMPSIDQKQKLVDANINYISLYDGVPVLETTYNTQDDYTQLSFIQNIMLVQAIVKEIRSRCPRTRYTFLDGEDLETYLDDVKTIIDNYKSMFKSIEITYMADEQYESNNIFYAVIVVQFRNFVQEEYFRVLAIN